MKKFSNDGNAAIIVEVCFQIEANREYLSDIDGLTGDGDHGVNMSKGFSMAREKITGSDRFSIACKKLGDVLLLEIGGSMGPIYGTFFRSIASVTKAYDEIELPAMTAALEKALNGIMDIGGAKVGDKTLIDTLYPAVEAFKAESDYDAAIEKAITAAEAGMYSTKNLWQKLAAPQDWEKDLSAFWMQEPFRALSFLNLYWKISNNTFNKL